MASQPPPPPSGPPADYFMTPPGAGAPPPAAVPYAMPPDQAGAPPYGLSTPQPAWQQPAPYAPVAVGAGVGLGVLSQFTGTALSSCIVGLVTIIIPFAFGYVFYILPIVGILAGVRAIMRGKVIGGGVGIALNVIGGLVTLIALKGY